MFLSKFSTTIPNNHIHTTSPPLLPVSSLNPLYPSSLPSSPFLKKKKTTDPIYGPSHRLLDPGSSHISGAPVLCTEFGGINISSPTTNNANDPSSRKSNWGYTTARDAADLLHRIDDMIMATVEQGHVCGIVWTQFTDIEQEQNGLYTYDRREKVAAGEMRKVMQKAERKYFERLLG